MTSERSYRRPSRIRVRFFRSPCPVPDPAGKADDRQREHGGRAVGATQAVHAPIGVGLGAAMGLAVAGALVGSLRAPLLDRTEGP
jgi:hypothetical protein